jgi:hypothetical protein
VTSTTGAPAAHAPVVWGSLRWTLFSVIETETIAAWQWLEIRILLFKFCSQPQRPFEMELFDDCILYP